MSARTHTLRLIAAVALASWALAACMVPYQRSPGFHGSRSDLTDEAVAHITVGQSTRQDVRALLPAEPDVAGIDGRWAYYQSHYLEAEWGVWVAIAAPGGGAVFPWAQDARYLLRRLLVRYDADGLVSAVEDTSAVCAGLSGFHTFAKPSEPDMLKCPLLGLDVAVRQQRQEARQRLAFPDSEGPWQRFPSQGVLWQTGPLHHMLGIHETLRCGVAPTISEAALGLSPRSIVLLPGERWQLPVGPGEDATRLARDQIARVRMIHGWLENDLGVEITLANGSLVTLAVCKHEGDAPGRLDAPANRAVFEQLHEALP